MGRKKAGMVAIAVVVAIALAYTATACPMGWGYGYSMNQGAMPMWYFPWNYVNQPPNHINQPEGNNISTPWWYPWTPNQPANPENNPQPYQNVIPCYHGWHRMGCW